MENKKNQGQKETGVLDQVSETETETETEAEEELTDIQEQEKTLEEILQEEVNQLKDKYLRAEAEIQNVRKMADQQTTKARLYGSESFAKEILSLGDNLERALDSLNANPNLKTAIEGIELTLKAYEKILENQGITSINPLKEKFNAEQHQAMTVIEDKNLDDNTVKEVVQKGYLLFDRVLRPAMVIVSKKSPSKIK